MFCYQITTDHLEDDGEDSIAGSWRGEHEEMDTKAASSRTFYLYDDDGVRYYTGRMYWDYEGEPTEDDSYELFLWGQRYAGTALLKFHGASHLDIG